MPERLLLTVKETAAALAIGKSKAFAMAASGELPSIRMGRSVRVPRAALEAWIKERAVTAANGDGPEETNRGRLRSG